MLVELHSLTSHPPANLNRDDLGRPKEAIFGGVRRARISSQSLKRSIRRSPYLQERFGDRISTRSLHIPLDLYADLRKHYQSNGNSEAQTRLECLGPVCEAVTSALGKAETVSKRVADAYNLNAEEKALKLKTSQIVFLTPEELRKIKDAVRGVVESDETLTKTILKELPKRLAEATGLNERPSDGVDLALFGRMTTDEANAFTAVEAAMQVAHPISTHAVTPETDWFSAVDEVVEEKGGRGSGHLNETEFNSAVFYKYFSCNLPVLVENLRGARKDAVETLAAFLEAACKVTPTGKQNSFASHALADAVLLVLREEHIPVSLANAFESPVTGKEDGRDTGYLAESRQRLVKHYSDLLNGYGFHDRAIFFTPSEDAREVLAGQLPQGVEITGRLNDVFAFLKKHAASSNGAEDEV